MKNQVIPAQAVEAALAANRAYKSQRSMDNAEKQMLAVLEAAAPHMLAGAWEQGYMYSYDQERGGNGDSPSPVPEHLTDDIVQWNSYRPAP